MIKRTHIKRTHIKRTLKALQPFRRMIEALAQRLPGLTVNADSPAQAAGSAIRSGLWLMVIVFGCFGLWSAFAPLDSAAVAFGQVVLDSNKKAIQHLEGGIVDAILVREGERVEVQQPLIRLKGTAHKAKLASLQIQYFTAQATEARLKAEQESQESLHFSPSLIEEAEREIPKKEALTSQLELFATRRKAYISQVNSLNKKIEEYKHDIDGFSTQVKTEAKQIELLEEEIASTQRLFAKGYASKPRLLGLQRQAEEMRGQQGQHLAAIARTKQSIEETREQKVTLQQDMLARVASELKDTQAMLADLHEQLQASHDIVERVTITSPINGYVTGLSVHTVGGVIAPGEKLMDVVPASDKLIIEAQVAPQDIDVVHPGLSAYIRLSAYRSRWVPSIEGKVITVSADRMTDNRTLASYFLARIEVNQEQLKYLKNVTLYPGMPAETLIVTGERTLLGYLFMPIFEATQRAFREE